MKTLDVTSARVRWYNPFLDPLVWWKITEGMAINSNPETSVYPGPVGGGPLNTPDDGHAANLISSLCTDELHRPALDIDLEYGDPTIPPVLALVFPDHTWELVESTSGFIHAYGHGPGYTFDEYMRLVRATNLCEDAYLDHAEQREQTLLRVPGLSKHPALAALRAAE